MLKNLGDPLDGEKSQVALIDLSEGEDVYTYAQLETQIEAQAHALGIDQKDPDKGLQADPGDSNFKQAAQKAEKKAGVAADALASGVATGTGTETRAVASGQRSFNGNCCRAPARWSCTRPALSLAAISMKRF